MTPLVSELPVAAEHNANMGWVEGPGNRNPWTRELGIGDAAYCLAAATRVAYHHGVRWWDWMQFGPDGAAYCPYGRSAAIRAGVWAGGRYVDLQPFDIALMDWNGDEVMDHAVTILRTYSDNTFDTWEYNSGHPEGAHIVHRDRKYLGGRIRMRGVFYGASPTPAPVPPPPPKEEKVNAVITAPVSGETSIAELRDDGIVYLRNIKDGSAWYNTGPLPPNSGKPVSMDAGHRPDDTLDVSVRTDRGVTWVVGAPPGHAFGGWYVPK